MCEEVVLAIPKNFPIQGYALNINILSDQECIDVIAKLNRYKKWLEKNKISFQSHGRFKLHLLLPWLYKVVTHPTLIESVKIALNSPNISIWSTDICFKKAKSNGYFPPHQDATYAGLSNPESVLTAWIALTPSNEESGCLYVIPKSHLLGQIPHCQKDNDSVQESDTNNMLVHGQFCPIPKNYQNNLVPMILNPGEVSLHSFYTIHESRPNKSNYHRIGLAVRFFDSLKVKRKNYDTDVKEMVTHVTGCPPPPDSFDLDFTPNEECGDEEVKQWRDALNRETENYFKSR